MMQPIRAPDVSRTDSFDGCVDALRASYPEIDSVIADFIAVLKQRYPLKHVPVQPDDFPNFYARRLDYEPAGAAGRGRFLVTYHVTPPLYSPNHPISWVTLILIVEHP